MFQKGESYEVGFKLNVKLLISLLSACLERVSQIH